MTKEGLTELIRQKIAAAGSQKDFAASCGVSPQYVSDVLRGRREPAGKLLAALSLERVVTYSQIRLSASDKSPAGRG